MKARRSPFAMVPLWVYDHPDVTPTVLQVYLGLAALTYDRAARSNVTEIGERASLGKSSTYAALATLADLGAVVREGRDTWYLPMDEPADDSATVENPSATTESDSTTVDAPLSREVSRGEEVARSDARAQFEDHFWPAYPPRDDRKLYKAKALEQWCRLTLDERRQALKAAKVMAAKGVRPPDAFRWLRDKVFVDWLVPAAGGGVMPAANTKVGRGFAAIDRVLGDEPGPDLLELTS